MLPIVFAAAGAVISAVLVRDRRRIDGAERLAAATLETLLNAIDANDASTGAHVRRVAAYAMALAGEAGVDAATCKSVERIALFHDVGKIHEALFDIIHDADALSPEEREAVRTHPARGAKVLEPLSAFYPDLAPGVLAHHECWNGKGYPRGLQGDAIPLAARIVAIADTYDAVSASRRYRAGAGASRALEVIRDGRGTQFDPTLVDHFVSPRAQSAIAEVTRVARDGRAAAAVSRSESTSQEGPAAERRKHTAESAVPNVRFRWRDDLRAD